MFLTFSSQPPCGTAKHTQRMGSWGAPYGIRLRNTGGEKQGKQRKWEEIKGVKSKTTRASATGPISRARACTCVMLVWHSVCNRSLPTNTSSGCLTDMSNRTHCLLATSPIPLLSSFPLSLEAKKNLLTLEDRRAQSLPLEKVNQLTSGELLTTRLSHAVSTVPGRSDSSARAEAGVCSAAPEQRGGRSGQRAVQ